MKKVIIFDLDGVLVDSQALQYGAYNEVFSRYGHPISRSEWQKWATESLSPALWIKQKSLPLDSEKIRAEKKIIYDSLIVDELQLMPGAGRFVRNVAEHFRLCVASASRLESIKLALQKFSLDKYFDKFFSDVALARKKPFPDLFLHAAAQMGAAAQDCIVIEDSLAGLRIVADLSQDLGNSIKSFRESISRTSLLGVCSL